MLRNLPTLPLGHSLQGRYRIVKKLGSGGYGSVYLAQDSRLPGRNVAVKELSDPSTAAKRLFQQEAAVLASLDHLGLVKVSDFFNEGRSSYLVMDYIEGRDLLEIAVEAEKKKQLLPVDQVVTWMLQVCEAVAYLHRRTPSIVHRDIKPNNIRLSTRGQAILVDFGIAKIDPKAKTQKMAKAISEGFSPPEQYAGAGGTNTRSDVYALGATLYCLLTVTPPPDSFERLTQDVPLVSPRQVNKLISKDLEQVVLKAMDLNELLRYQDGGEMLVALQKATGRPVTPLPQLSSPVLFKPPGQKNCPRCGAPYRKGARFCPQCGASLVSGQRCPRCGRLNRPGARFCSQCRTSLSSLGPARPRARPRAAVSPQVCLKRGHQRFQADDFANAAVEYENAVRGGIDDADVYANLGRCYLELNRADDAVTLLETGVRKYSRDARLYTQLALAYMGAQKFSQGIQTLELAHQLDPQNPAVAALLAQVYTDIGKHDKALPILEALLRLQPHDKELRTRLAFCYLAVNRLREAERIVKDLRYSNPDMAALSFLMGIIKMQKGNLRAGLRELQKAISQDPGHALAHYFIGEIYFQQKRWRDALGAYQRSARANPRDADPHAKMCLCHIAMNNESEALKALQRALQINPNNALARQIAMDLTK